MASVGVVSNGGFLLDGFLFSENSGGLPKEAPFFLLLFAINISHRIELDNQLLERGVEFVADPNAGS